MPCAGLKDIHCFVPGETRKHIGGFGGIPITGKVIRKELKWQQKDEPTRSGKVP
jgi:hypothetical protein